MMSHHVWYRALCATVALVVMVSCRAPKEAAEGTPPAKDKSAKAEASRSKPPAEAESREAPKVRYSATYDEEIKVIFDLAESGRWEEAEAKASALSEKDPSDAAVQRIVRWVTKQRQLRREQAVEDKIRDVDAKSSPFNPTVPGLLTERKDRGLAPRKDVRDAVDRIENTPYVPDSFGKTVIQRGELYTLDSNQGRMSRILEKEVSIQLDNVTLEAIIFNLGLAEGVNFIADKSLPAFKQTLSINLQKVKLSELLSYVSRNLEVQFQVGEDLIWVVDGKDPKKTLNETRFYRLKKGFVLPAKFGLPDATLTRSTVNNITTVTETQKLDKFVNDGASEMPSIEMAIKQFFVGTNAPAPKYMVDYERNLIVAQGTRDQLMVMDKIVQEFDQPIQQIYIEARFITVTRAAFLKLGALWETGRPLSTPNAVDYTGLTQVLGGNGESGRGLQESFTNILGRKNLTATLTALEQGGESQTLSAPRLTVINNLPARISDGQVQYYYEEYQVKQTLTERTSSSALYPSGKPVKVTAGANLMVLASVGGDGKSVLLALNPEINSNVTMEEFTSISDSDANGNPVNRMSLKLPIYRTQSLATRAVVKSGETVVMGGVLERSQATLVESVPVLSRIPIIGAAFRRRTEQDKPRYLLIFVTATLLTESGEFLLFEGEGESK
jgi:type IV pilus assembly protein PilQ